MRITLAAVAVALVAAVGPSSVRAQETPSLPKQDPQVLRFIERAVAWYPSSSFRITEDLARHTPSGRYRVLQVERSCESPTLTGTTTVVLDEASRTVWLGISGELPTEQMNVDPGNLRPHMEEFLPQLLATVMHRRVEVDWDKGDLRTGALIPFHIKVETGYGFYRQSVAMSSDGGYFVLGTPLPYDQDPVAYRRQLLRASSHVVWDGPSEEAKVEIVEFSDFECPGCKKKWPLIKSCLEKHGPAISHGFVTFPLTTIHPWAFRAASAGWCVGERDPALVLPFKEHFYSLQSEMEVSLVTDTALDFVAAHGLDEDEFLACYLRQPSLDGVHAALALGNGLGVNATPTYYINGWLVQVPSEEWLDPLLERLIRGEEP